MNGLSKHIKYREKYRAGEVFWGFGVEHETYLESAVFQSVSRADLKLQRRPERYSIAYYKNYKVDELNAAFDTLPVTVDLVPVLLNSHTLTYTDISMNHQTTYEQVSHPNPRFLGHTVHDDFMVASSWYRNAYDKSVVYDGDTFEFMSINFYNATVKDALEELWEVEDRFMWEFNNFIMKTDSVLSDYGPYGIARANYPFAVHLTNPYHYSMFNNGTMHVNITLPTELDAHGQIADLGSFERRHRASARYFQWFEPLLVVMYGGRDPFSNTVHGKFSAASQRLAVSRYIGLANYNTEDMPPGKILTCDVSGRCNDWYEKFYEQSAYVKLPDRGLDINYMKHWNHGLELRIFDGLRREQMLAVCNICWNLCLKAQDFDLVDDCRTTPWFQEFVLGCMLSGTEYVVEWAILQKYLAVIHYSDLLCEFEEKEPVHVGDICRVVLKKCDTYTTLFSEKGI